MSIGSQDFFYTGSPVLLGGRSSCCSSKVVSINSKRRTEGGEAISRSGERKTSWNERQDGVVEVSTLSPLVQASAPRTVRGRPTSATLGKPLIREFLFYRSGKLLSKSSGSGLCVAQEPRLPRIHTLRQ